MQTTIPGLNPKRLVGLMRAAVSRCTLDLSSFVVLTEAASGAYVVTPVLAALAGAEHVFAVARSTRYGTVDQIAEATIQLATHAGVKGRVELITERSRTAIEQTDVITNSGRVRPIDEAMIACMKSTAVIPLMYEAWEFRDGDVDLVACRKRGIRVIGTNERHPAVDVFSFLGTMAVKLLLDAGVSVYSSRVLLVCNNSFGAFLERGLVSGSARVDIVSSLSDAPSDAEFDVVLVAVTPTGRPSLSDHDVSILASRWPGAVVAIFWGDVDRRILDAAGLSYWPFEAPSCGHMSILPSAIGPEPIVRLQCGSLKAAEAVLRYSSNPSHPAHEFGQEL
jgi:hypothetical protein